MVLYGVVALVGGTAIYAAVRHEASTAAPGPSVPLGDVLRERRLLVVSGALFLGMASLYGPLTWVASFMDEIGGFSDAERSVAGLIIAAAAIPGSILGGVIAGRTGRPAETYAAFLVLCLPVVVLAFGTEDLYAVVTLVAALSRRARAGP